jgi:hypothetical protein
MTPMHCLVFSPSFMFFPSFPPSFFCFRFSSRLFRIAAPLTQGRSSSPVLVCFPFCCVWSYCIQPLPQHVRRSSQSVVRLRHLRSPAGSLFKDGPRKKTLTNTVATSPIAFLAAWRFRLHSLSPVDAFAFKFNASEMRCFEQHQNESNKQKSIELHHRRREPAAFNFICG